MSDNEKKKTGNNSEPKANKPIRETDGIEQNDLPYDPNINKDDLQALHREGLSMDQGRDKFLSDRKRPVDFTGNEMDIPSRDESDTSQDGTDLPDEENNQYNERGVRKDEDMKRDLPNSNRDVSPTN
ncbi:MAG TPA: hypothetical protein VK941_08690 [Gillisia sp.]|nr:hypothetical protein [Gillisia sp.]